MSYRRNTSSDRDALFGSSSKSSAPSGPRQKRDNEANRNDLFGSATSSDKKKSSSSSGRRPAPKAAPEPAAAAAPSRGYSRSTKTSLGGLTGAAKQAKRKEADEYRDQAVKAMQKGLFAKPDPLAGANYYQRAADAYGQCGEARLERLHRAACADCYMSGGSFPSAAMQYVKAAELSRTSDQEADLKRKEGWKLYDNAAKAWTNAGQSGKAANAQIQSALALTWDDETTLLGKDALTSMEVAIETHVPDVLNVYARHRQTGISKYIDPNDPEPPSSEVMALAKDHAVNTPYCHEPIHEMVYALIHYGEYPSALYASGAASYILENDGISTLTLSRNYIMETILQLAMGDPVAAEEAFLQRHVQHSSYLTSRECKLAEELYRAVLNRDPDALDEARSPKGANKSAMAQLHQSLRGLVHQLRISGAARRAIPDTTATKASKKAPILDDDDSSAEEVPSDDDSIPEEPERSRPVPKKKDESDDELDTEQMQQEMNDIMASLDDLGGLDSSDDDDFDDDDIDLR